MRRLMPFVFILCLAAALEVTPQEAFHAEVGRPVIFTVEVSGTAEVTVESDDRGLFSWTEKRIFGSVGEDTLVFTPDEPGDYEFTVSGEGRSVGVLVEAVETTNHTAIKSRYLELFSELERLEEEREGHSGVNTADIYRTLQRAESHLETASEAYNSSRYATAELEMGRADAELEEAEAALAGVGGRPRESPFTIDLVVMVAIMVGAIALAAKYFLL